MAQIIAVGTAVPEHRISQDAARLLAKTLFSDAFADIDRLLKVFANTQIASRHFCVPPEWFLEEKDLASKSRIYVEKAEELGEKAIRSCLESSPISPHEIDHLIFVSTTGWATPSIDARLINRLNMRPNVKRTPIWGLGCAGGAAGLSRAFEYARAFPESNVLLVAVELCGLTFLRHDRSKSNLIAASLFADGAAAVLICGERAAQEVRFPLPRPSIAGTKSTLWPHSLDVMGWEMTNDGLKVIFSRDIPTLVDRWMKANVSDFLQEYRLSINDIRHFIPHPGGAKVLAAYEKALAVAPERLENARSVLNAYGNMSSATVLFVLEKTLSERCADGEYGLVSALGPGFSSELLLLHWK
ncbi:type III polyketide synthase BpsA [Bacillaceae bacterium]